MNDAPVLESVSDVSFDEDGSGSASLSGSDVDGDVLTYSMTGGSDITATLDGSDVSFSTTENYNGSEVFNVSVSDGEYTDSQSITVTVNAINDDPVATSASVETAEDQSVVVSLSGSDIDGDNLTFSLDSDASYGSVSLNGSLATYTPNTNYNGDDSFTFNVSDGSGSSSASVTLSVSAVNDAPVLASVSDVSFDEDLSGSLSLSVDDVDGDELAYSITGGSDIVASLDGSDISFSAPTNYNGSEVFSVLVSDGTVTDSQSFTVTVDPVNDPPIATSGIESSTIEGQSVVIALSATDIDSNNLAYSLDTDALNGDVVIDGTFATYTPNANFNGNDIFVFSVSDGIDSSIASVSLNVTAVNDAPVLATLSNVVFDEDDSSILILSASDIDGDDLSFSITGGDNISASIVENQITFTADANYNGSEVFLVTVSDGELIDTQNISVTVNAINDAPIASDNISGTTLEDESILISLSAIDVDGDNLIFSLDDDAANGSVVMDGSFATYSPNTNYNGDDSFTFSVSDGLESSSASVI